MIRINCSARTNGTSFHNHTFKASVNELRKAFGREAYQGDADDKVQHEWILQFSEDGESWDTVTVYDWKEFPNYSDDKIIEWHTGALSRSTTLYALDEIVTMIKMA